MSHMKWISSLKKSDLKTLKEILEDANEKNEPKVSFQESEYTVGYIKSVIDYLELVVFDEDSTPYPYINN